MDSKITSTTDRRRRAAFTIVEFMVASSIGSVVAVAVGSLLFYSGRSFAAMANYVELDHDSRVALDRMSSEIRQANRLKEFTSTSLTFEDWDGGTLTFALDPNSKTLRRIKNGVTAPKPLLRECSYLQFSIYQRNPVSGTYDQYPTASASTCKLVQLNWICSRRTVGSPVNTESVQSAKIVIRKQ